MTGLSPYIAPVDEYVIEIDPSEKEWLNALVDGNLDTLHHLIMTDISYVNRRGFINGWVNLLYRTSSLPVVVLYSTVLCTSSLPVVVLYSTVLVPCLL